MKNITVSVDEETHRLAHIRAAELDTSVSALVKEFLQSLAGSSSLVTLTIANSREKTALGLRPRDLNEVLADFDARGVGVPERLTRKELYDEATDGHNPLH